MLHPRTTGVSMRVRTTRPTPDGRGVVRFSSTTTPRATTPWDLLPAWQLYSRPTYALLANHYGVDRFYILSAGWGLIRGDFLTPNYDITFSTARNVEKFKRRSPRANYHDFRMLPTDTTDQIVFFGGKGYVSLFCELTAGTRGRRSIFYAGSKPHAPGCTLSRFGQPFTNWHYQCAENFVQGAR